MLTYYHILMFYFNTLYPYKFFCDYISQIYLRYIVQRPQDVEIKTLKIKQ